MGKNNVLRVFRFACLLCIIGLGLITIVGTGGGGGGGGVEDTSPPVPDLTITPHEDIKFTLNAWRSGVRAAEATGGKPTYYYTLETMGGFPPMGIILNQDGTLSGTPSVAGTYTFGVCVVDLAASQDCKDVIVEVEEIPAVTGPAGQVMFWSDVSDEGNIEIFVDGFYRGTLTKYYTSNPGSCGASGGLTLDLAAGSHSFTAKSGAGSSWSDSITVTEDECLLWKLYSSDGDGDGGGIGGCPTLEDLCGSSSGGQTLATSIIADCECPDGTTQYGDLITDPNTGGLLRQCLCP